MSLFDRLGPAVVQELSAHRDAVPKELFVGPDAAQELAQALAAEVVGGRDVVVLSDVRTRVAAGDACLRALTAAGFVVHERVLPDVQGHGPVCDDRTKNALQAELPSADAIVGVGSGTISDLGKWLAFEASVPGAVFATAASMNGYSAANVAPAIEGVKSLFQARAHRFIAADPAVLARAPRELTAAGLGDVIAKSVSTADWKMNELLFGERYSDAIASIIDDVEKRFLADPRGLARGEPDAVRALFEALVYSGCAMTLQGSSMPASGGEHLISHALDMWADAHAGRHDLHGRQVGVGTIFAAALYERVLARDALRFDPSPQPFDAAGWGRIAPSVRRHHDKQRARLARAAHRLNEPGVWPRVRQALGALSPGAAWVKGVLKDAGAAHRLEDIGCSRAHFLWVVHNCAQIRERFTSIDLAWASGVLPGAAEAIVDQWLTA